MKSKKAAGWLLTAVFVVLAALAPALSGGMRVYAADSDFEITDGVLTNYKGSGGAVKIPSGKVTAIDDEAFYNCVGITSLTVPEGVKTVGKKAFYNCSSMTDISLPASVKSIGELSFEGCSKLQNINVAENSGYYASEGGVLLNSEKTQLLRYPQGKEDKTGYIYESWHVRYVGKELARKVTDSGLCLEEYLGIDSYYHD